MYPTPVTCDLVEVSADEALQFLVTRLMVKIVIPDDAKARLQVTPRMVAEASSIKLRLTRSI